MSTEVNEKPKALVNVINGDMVAENPEGVLKVASMHMRSGMLPKHYNTVEKVVSAMTLAKEMGLKPLSALRQIAVINGSPSLYGDLPLALAMNSDQFEYIREYYIDEKQDEILPANKNITAKIFGAVCITKRKGAPHEHVTWFTLEDKVRAGLNSPVWKSYERIMLKYRARSINLKDNFPECINGVAIAEYDNSVLPEVEGKVINSVLNNGERSRMSKIREAFVEEIDEQITPQIELGDQADQSDGLCDGHGATQKKPTKSRKKVHKPPAEVGGTEPVEENGEVPDLWVAD